MIYLLIIVGIAQLFHFLYCCKMMMSVKRRHRIIDVRIKNLTAWIITSNQSVNAQLNKMNELLQNLPVKHEDQPEHLQQLNKNTGTSHQPSETVLRPVNGYAG